MILPFNSLLPSSETQGQFAMRQDDFSLRPALTNFSLVSEDDYYPKLQHYMYIRRVYVAIKICNKQNINKKDLQGTAVLKD